MLVRSIGGLSSVKSAGPGSALCRFSTGKPSLGFFRNLLGLDVANDPNAPTDANRFHPFDESPSEALRQRAAFIKARAKDPTNGLPIQFTCPKSGIPTHHSEESWKADTEYWATKKWQKLRWANVFDHDLRSGREFPELDFPGAPDDDQIVNYLNWDTFFYTRNFYSMDSEFNLAVATKMLSYPVTMASILDSFSPYSLQPRGPLTLEGLKSAAALRYTLFPQDKSKNWQDRPVRFFILGARMESQLPVHSWKQLSYLLPDTKFELIFIGPEAYYDRRKGKYAALDRPLTERIDQKLSLVYYTDYFHVLNEARDFMPYDPYLDAFFLFHPGLGAPEAMDQWNKSMPGLLESKCPIYVTGFNEADSKQDWNWLMKSYKDELDVLIEPTANIFHSTKWEFNDLNPHELYQLNQQLFGFRGKRYHVQFA